MGTQKQKKELVLDVAETAEVPEAMKGALVALMHGALSGGTTQDLAWALETAYLLGAAGKHGEKMMDARWWDRTTVRQAAA